jgi:long-chain fatty acid transport protein
MRKLSGKRNSTWLVAGLVSGTTLVTTTIPNIAFASGFSLSEQSARTLGQAFSGRASDADAATTLADNPAGMSRLARPEFSGGFALVDAHADISNASGSTSTPFGTNPVDGSNDGDMIPLTPIPFGFYVHPIDDRLALGFGIYAPFGLTTDYESDFQGRYFGTESAIQVITAQPTLSYKIGNGFSMGFGLTYNRFDGELKKDIFNAIPGSPDINGGVKGDDWAWGYNVGILYELDEDTRFGLTYFSKVDYTLEGRTRLENVPVGPAFFPSSSVRYDAELDITTPERISASRMG